LSIKIFYLSLQPHKKRQTLFGAMGFSYKSRQIQGGRAEKPEQPFGCEDFEGDGQRRILGILWKTE
jgi:hypothetical protein